MSDPTTRPANKIASTERTISAPVPAVFGAFASPDRLAEWWGPKGFRNTFERFEFVPGGRWVFVMHGPDGSDYANESAFQEIVPNERIVVRHLSQPTFTLSVSLSARDLGTRVQWVQEFDSGEVAERLRHIVEPANEQNLDRLQSIVEGGRTGSPAGH